MCRGKMCVWEMSVGGNVRRGKRPSGGNVCRGNCSSEKCPFGGIVRRGDYPSGKLTVREMSVGGNVFGEMSVEEILSENCLLRNARIP